MAWYLIEGSDGTAIVDETEAMHLYLTREDADRAIREELDAEPYVVAEIELEEPDEDDEAEQELVYLVREKDSEELLTTEEEREDGEPIAYLLAFLDPDDAEAFIESELKEADPENYGNSEIVEARIVRS